MYVCTYVCIYGSSGSGNANNGEFVSKVMRQSHGQNRLGFVYEHFDSCDQFLVKSIFDFSNIFRVLKSCAVSTTVE